MDGFSAQAESTPAQPTTQPIIPTAEQQRAFLDGQGEDRYATLDPGERVKGVVTEVVLAQDTDFTTRQPVWIEPGTPQMFMRVRLRDGSGAQAQRWIVDIRKGQRRDAIRHAVQNAGASAVEPGGKLELTCVSRQGNRKIYAATYEPPQQPSESRPPSMADAQGAVTGAFTLPGDPSVHPSNQGFPVANAAVRQQAEQPPF